MQRNVHKMARVLIWIIYTYCFYEVFVAVATIFAKAPYIYVVLSIGAK